MGAVNGYGINGETVGAGSPGSIVNSAQIREQHAHGDRHLWRRRKRR
jgi:hypothetical protein